MTKRMLTALAIGLTGWSAAEPAEPDSNAVLPKEWVVFGPVLPDEGRSVPDRTLLQAAEASLGRIPDALELDGRAYPGRTVSLDPTGRLDLGALFGAVPRGTTAFLMAPLTADRDQTVRMGVGADWWMQWWLDGKPVFDTLAAGNRKAPVSPANHPVELALKAGAHVLAAAVIAGSGGLLFAVGAPEAAYAQAMAEGRDAQDKALKLNGPVWADRAREHFQQALDRAGDELEQAYALLALGDTYRTDPVATNAAAIREIYERVLALADTSASVRNRKGEACIAIGETWLRGGDPERAREAAARALEASSDPRVVLPARRLAARTHLREGRYDDARAELQLLRTMTFPDWVRDAQRLLWEEETDSLRELIDTLEIWSCEPKPQALAVSRDARDARQPPAFADVVRALRRDRPRLFLNQDTLDRIQRDGLTADQAAWLAELKRRVDRYPEPPVLDDAARAEILGGQGENHHGRAISGDWGYYAAHAALVGRLTGDPAYIERAALFLEHAAAVLDVIYTGRRLVAERIFHRINALSAYDWLYHELPADRRQAIGRMLFPPLVSFYERWRQQWGNRDSTDPAGYGIGYTDVVMGWYLGLTFLGADIDDERCVDLLRDGYRRHTAYFRLVEGYPDGVILRGAIGYFTQGANSPVNFLDSYRAATGDDFARYVPKRAAGEVSYALWNIIVPTRHPQLTYGWSDKYHDNNQIGGYRSWLTRAPDVFAGIGAPADLEALAALAQAQVQPDYSEFISFDDYLTPASPLLMPRQVLPDTDVAAVLERLPRARHFPDPVGQTFMNSGWGSNDTYALFVAGRQTPVRKHYDENHFTIYKKGFLAMDTGARAVSVTAADGSAPAKHEIYYYYDTIAHNAVLIRMEGEQLPGFWGMRSAVNTGGMNRNHGARVLAFETDSLCTYIASDATSCYHPDKAAEVVRQFLFVYPDWFVVFDRVESKAADQAKTWLFHTQMEPVETGDTFRAEHRDGAVCVRTLLPRDRSSEKIGGPGKEFWAGDRNWPVSQRMQRLMVDEDGRPTPDRNLYGQWRMEISPAEARARDLFLHLIQVGAKQELQGLTPSTLIEDDRTAGVEFQAGARTVRVMFHKSGPAGGHIRLAEGDTVLADRPLAVTVQRQEGLALVR